MDRLEPMANRESAVFVDSLGNRETLVLRVLQGLKVLRVRMAIRAQPVHPDPQELPD